MRAVGKVLSPGVFVPALFPPYLDQGSTGPAVTALQLILVGMFPEQQFITGEYDEQTTVNVTVLQIRLGFEGADIDGNFGPGTRRRLKEQMGIDVDEIDVTLFAGATNYKSPDGGGVWNGVQSRE